MSLSFLTHPYPDCRNVFKNVQFQHDFSVIKTYFSLIRGGIQRFLHLFWSLNYHFHCLPDKKAWNDQIIINNYNWLNRNLDKNWPVVNLEVLKFLHSAGPEWVKCPILKGEVCYRNFWEILILYQPFECV